MDSSLVKMANQIGTFFAAQTPDDEAAAARAVASHLKLFWAPTMRAELARQIEHGEAADLLPMVASSVRNVLPDLHTKGSGPHADATEITPEGGGDAG